MKNGTNGTNKLVWWGLGILGSLIVLGATGWVSSIHSTVRDLVTGLTRVETRVRDVDRRLDRIEDAIDMIRRNIREHK